MVPAEVLMTAAPLGSAPELSATDLGQLLEAIEAISRLQSRDDLMAVVRRAARRLTAADGVSFVLREGAHCFYADEDAVGPLWKGRRFPAESCVSGWAMRHRTDVVIEDIYRDARVPHEAYRPTFVRSLAMVPIRRDDPLGAIGAYWASVHRATPRELTILTTLANATAVAIANDALYREVEAEARRKDELLAMLGHELRNPLTPVRTVLDLLRRRGLASLDQRQFDVLDRQVANLARLVDDLVDVARITRGTIELRRHRVELASVVGRAVDATRSLFEAKRQALEVLLPRGPAVVDGDGVRLEQIVTNLLANAARYTDPGGHVQVALAADAGTAEIRVKDDGIGMDPELLGRIFRLFEQGARSLARSAGGLGLGLTVARSVTELHGGTIEARSDGPGKGSELVVRLPLASEDARGADPTPVPTAAGTLGLDVLVVDDNGDAAEAVAELLRELGCRTDVAFDGAAALRLAAGRRFDAVLLDIGLPELDGYEVARRLVAAGRKPALLVALTGYGQDGDRARAREAGFDHHVVKPVRAETLGTLLEPLAARSAPTRG